MTRAINRWIAVMKVALPAVILLLGLAAANARTVPGACDLVVHNGTLTAYIVDTPLGDVVAQLEVLTGARTFVDPKAAGVLISAEVAELSVSAAVRVILRGHNTSLITIGEQLSEIWVLGQGTTAPRRHEDDGAGAVVKDPPAPQADGTAAPQGPNLTDFNILRTAAADAADSTRRIEALTALVVHHAGTNPEVEEIVAAAVGDGEPTVHQAAVGLARYLIEGVSEVAHQEVSHR